MKRLFMLATVVLIMTLVTEAQEYKIRQVTTVNEMKIDMTKYIKGRRERTEQGVVMGIGGNIATIIQCDLKRTITLNTKKKNYTISPFGMRRNANVGKGIPVHNEQKKITKGGKIEVWYSLNDTGERKKMFGFTARHIWGSQKMYPSKDACNMKDSIIIKTDGWYIDLAEFNCPNEGSGIGLDKSDGEPECQDKIVEHISGKAKLGFPLFQTTIIITRDPGTKQWVEMKTVIETIELSTAKLDTMLFTIPPGYTEARTDAELQDEFNPADMGNIIENAAEEVAVRPSQQKAPGRIRVGVYAPEGNSEVDAGLLQRKLLHQINKWGIEAIGVTSDEDAQKYHCDYVLNTVLTEVKSSANVGGILKAITKRDPNAVANFKVQGKMILRSISDGSVKNEKTIDGKYDGNQTEAAGKAVEEYCQQLLMVLK